MGLDFDAWDKELGATPPAAPAGGLDFDAWDAEIGANTAAAPASGGLDFDAWDSELADTNRDRAINEGDAYLAPEQGMALAPITGFVGGGKEDIGEDGSLKPTLRRLGGAVAEEVKEGFKDIAPGLRSGKVIDEATFKNATDPELLDYYQRGASLNSQRVEELQVAGVPYVEAIRQAGIEGAQQTQAGFKKAETALEGAFPVDPSYAGKSSGKVEDVVRGVSRSLPGMAATVANPVVGMGVLHEQIAGQSFKENESKGADPYRNAVAANVSAAIQTPLESAGNLLAIGAIKRAFGGNALAAKAADLFKVGGGEALENVLQGFPEDIANYWTNNPESTLNDAAKATGNDPELMAKTWERAWQGAAGGLLLAGAGQTAGSVYDASRRMLKKPDAQTAIPPVIAGDPANPAAPVSDPATTGFWNRVNGTLSAAPERQMTSDELEMESTSNPVMSAFVKTYNDLVSGGHIDLAGKLSITDLGRDGDLSMALKQDGLSPDEKNILLAMAAQNGLSNNVEGAAGRLTYVGEGATFAPIVSTTSSTNLLNSSAPTPAPQPDTASSLRAGDPSRLNATAFPGSSQGNHLSHEQLGAFLTDTPAGQALSATLAELRANGQNDLADKIQITSANAGGHVPNSRHYKGQAVDINARALTTEEQAILAGVAQRNGLVHDVAGEPWHFSYRGQNSGGTAAPTTSLADRVIQAESNGNPNAQAGTSSARGLGQFTRGTRDAILQQHGVDAWSKDPAEQRRATELLIEENRQSLRQSLGREPNDGEIYMAQFLGAGGASKFLPALSQAPNDAAANHASPAAVNANQSIFYHTDQKGRPILDQPRTVQQVYDLMAAKVGGGQTVSAGAATTAQPGQAMPTQTGQPGAAPQAMDLMAPAQAAVPAASVADEVFAPKPAAQGVDATQNLYEQPIAPTAQPAAPVAAPIVAPQPEPQAYIDAQVQAMADPRSTKRAVLVSPGSPLPTNLPAGTQAFLTQHGTVLTSDKDLARRLPYDATDQQMGAAVLNWEGGRPPTVTGGKVVRALDANGTPVGEVHVLSKDVPKAMEAMRALSPVGKAVKVSLNTALTDRQQMLAQEQQAPQAAQAIAPGVSAPQVAQSIIQDQNAQQPVANEAGSSGEWSGHTVEDVQRAVPTGNVSETDYGQRVDLPNGMVLHVKRTGEIAMTAARAKIAVKGGYEASQIPRGKIVGAFQMVNGEGVIKLTEAGRGSIDEEVMHFARKAALTTEENALLNQEFAAKEGENSNPEERIAHAYQAFVDKRGPDKTGLFAKIMRFFEGIRQHLFPTAQGVFRQVADGTIWERAVADEIKSKDDVLTGPGFIQYGLRHFDKWLSSRSNLEKETALKRDFEKWATSMGYTSKQAKQVLDSIKDFHTVMSALPQELFDESTRLSPIRGNADYIKTVDMNTICPKRFLYAATINEIQGKLGRPLGQGELMRVAKLLKAEGKEYPCLYCYVESGRGAYNKAILDYIKNQDTTLDPRIFTDPELEKQARANPDMGARIKKARGYAQAASMSNQPKEYSEYKGQILRMGKALKDRINNRAGLRFFSNTDLQPDHILDLMQVITDMGMADMKGHLYTKVPETVEIFGGTGLKINMSIYATVKDGQLVFDDTQGFPWEKARGLRQRFENAGTIMVVSSEEALKIAMAHPEIDMIIPWHLSGQDSGVAAELGMKNFSYYQQERWLDPAAHKGEKAPHFYEDKHGNDKATYLRLCAEAGVQPKFPQHVINQGYMKMIRDYARTDTPQEFVRPVFDVEKATAVLTDWAQAGGRPNAPDAGIVEKFMAGQEQSQEATEDGVQYSLADTAGANANEVEEAQRLWAEMGTESPYFAKWFGGSQVVDDNGEPLVVYHQTAKTSEPAIMAEGFSTDAAKARARLSDEQVPNGIFFKPEANDIGVGAAEKSDQSQIPVYLSIKNPLVLKTRESMKSFMQLHSREYYDKAKDLAEADKRFSKEFDDVWNNGSTDHEAHMAALDAITAKWEADNKASASEMRSLIDDVLKENGHDGVIIEQDKGSMGRSTKTYIALESTQAKSATENKGTFDASDSRIQYSLNTANPLLTPDGLPSETLLEFVVRKMQDRMSRLTKTVKVLGERNGVPLADDKNAALLENLYQGRTEEALRQVEADHIKPLIEAIREAGVTVADVEDALYAMHAKRRNMVISGRTKGQNTSGSGITDAEADQIMDDLRNSGKLAKLYPIIRRVWNINKARLALLKSSGLESAETLDLWYQTYGENYVPLKNGADIQGGLLAMLRGEEHPRRSGTGRGYDIRGRESKHATGRHTKAGNILANILADYETTIIRAEKNRVGQAFLRMAEDNPDQKLWEIDKTPTKATFNVKTGEVETKKDPRYKLADNVFSVKVEGQERLITIKDEVLARAMKNLGAESGNMMLRMLAGYNRAMSLINTSLDPEFVISNFLRDIQTAGFNLTAEDKTALAAKILKDTATGKPIRGIYRVLREKNSAANDEWSQWFDRYRKAGGKIGFFGLRSVEDQANRIEGMLSEANGGAWANTKKGTRAVLDYINDMNGAVENGMRLAVFRRSVEAGMSEEQAASIAKELTVNFNKRGEASTVLNALYLFANASVQGNARILKALTTSKRGLILSGAIVASSVALAALNRQAGGDDEDGQSFYDKIDANVKARNLVLMKWWKDDGSYMTLPLPYGYNTLKVIGDQIESMAAGKQTPLQASGKIVSAFVDAFNPLGSSGTVIGTFLPTISRPFVDIKTNTDFGGNPIKPVQSQFGPKKPESQLAWGNVAKPAKWVAEELNKLTGGNEFEAGKIDVSPEVIEHLWSSYTGGVARFANRVVGLGMGAYQGTLPATKDIPFVRRLAGEQSPYVTPKQFREMSDTVKVKEDAYLAYRKTDPERAKAYRQDNLEVLAMAPKLTSIEKALEPLNSKRQEIKAMDLSDAEKALRFKPIDEKIATIQKAFIKDYMDKGATPQDVQKADKTFTLKEANKMRSEILDDYRGAIEDGDTDKAAEIAATARKEYNDKVKAGHLPVQLIKGSTLRSIRHTIKHGPSKSARKIERYLNTFDEEDDTE